MRLLGHGPFRINRQSRSRDLVARAVPPHEIADAAREGPDKELHWAHSRVGPAVLLRLIGDYRVRTAGNMKFRPATIDDRKLHRTPPRCAMPHSASRSRASKAKLAAERKDIVMKIPGHHVR